MSNTFEAWLERTTKLPPTLRRFDFYDGDEDYDDNDNDNDNNDGNDSNDENDARVEGITYPQSGDERNISADEEERDEWYHGRKKKNKKNDLMDATEVFYNPLSLKDFAAKVAAVHLATNADNYVKTLSSISVDVSSAIVQHTPPTCVEALVKLRKSNILNEGEPLVSILRLLYTINEYELRYLEQDEPPSGPSWSPPLIDVWKNYDSFVLEPSFVDEERIGKICFTTPPKSPTDRSIHSVADEAAFKKNFSIFTEGQFEGWNDWENMVVVGGSVVGSLLPIPDNYKSDTATYFHEIGYPSSDIDIYFYGLSVDEFAHKVDRLYHHLKKVNGEVLVVRTTFTVTFCSAWPKRHIQIVIGTWNNIAEVLFEPDIDCTCVAFDGTRLWSTQRARFSFNHRCILASPERYSVRGFPEYESRLIKYSKRGFNIWDPMMAPDFSNISLRYLQIGRERILEHRTVEGRAGVAGLRLLLVTYLWPRIFRLKNVRFVKDASGGQCKFKDEGLPYGPNWDIAKITKRLAEPIYEDSHYGPYEVTSPYVLVKDVVDWQSIVSPHRDKLVSMRNTRQPPTWNFHLCISIDHDQQERHEVKVRCGGCASQNIVWFKDMDLSFFCNECKDYAGENPKQVTSAAEIPPAISAAALFLDRAGSHERAEALAIEQGFDLKSLVDDPFLHIQGVRLTNEETANEFFIAVVSGDSVFIRDYISKHGLPVQDGVSDSPLHLAARTGHLDVARELIQAGADVNAYDARYVTPLHIACEHRFIDIALLLMQHRADVNSSKCGVPPIYFTLDEVWSRSGDPVSTVPLIRELVKAGAHLEGIKVIKNSGSGTYWDETIAKLQTTLIDDFKEFSLSGPMTPLTYACLARNSAVVGVLLELGADPEARINTGYTPLMICSMLGDSELSTALVKGGCDIEARNDTGETALFIASARGSRDVVEDLLARNADVDAERDDGETPLTISRRNGMQLPILFTGITKGLPLLEACKTGVVTDELRRIAKVWSSIEDLKEGPEGNLPVHIAALHGHPEIMRLLLENGATVFVDKPLEDRPYTPLHLAASKGNLQVVQTLVENGAKVDPVLEPPPVQKEGRGFRGRGRGRWSARGNRPQRVVNEEDWYLLDDPQPWLTPLYLAAQAGHAEVVEYLLMHHAHVTEFAGLVAAQEGHSAVLELLLRQSVDLKDVAMLLPWAALNGHLEAVKVLLSFGVDVNERVEGDMTPLHFAAYGGRVEIVDLLLNRGALINDATDNDFTALDIAELINNMALVNLLEDRKK